MGVVFSEDRKPSRDEVVALYQSVGWSSAERPEALHAALLGSHSLVTAWVGDRLVGVGNAVSDGHLVVYYPHLVVHPDFQGRGLGAELMRRLRERYRGFHQQVLLGDSAAIDFYRKLGFERAGATEPFWIFEGGEH